MSREYQTETQNPFAISETEQLDESYQLVAIKGERAGYLQLSSRTQSLTYEELPLSLLVAAKAWASVLEQHGAPRVYWINLSEVVLQLHVHLYPRWPEDEEKGIGLFEKRNTIPQPEWIPALENALSQWAKEYGVYVKN